MSHSARPLDAVGIFVVVALCMSFGLNQVAVKLALADIPPLTQSAARSIGAAFLVWLWMRLRGISIHSRLPILVPGIIAGLLFGLEFMLIYLGLRWTTASRAVVFLFVAPFFVTIGAHRLLPAERFGHAQWLGLISCFAGIALAFGIPVPASDPRQILGDVMMVGAAAAWAATTLVIKASPLNELPPEKTLFYQLVVSAPVLALGALVLGEPWPAAPSVVALISLAYQTIWVAGITYMIWFALILRYSASRVSAFTFLTPLFGVAAGHIVLGDPITPAFVGAVGMVAAGLVLVARSP